MSEMKNKKCNMIESALTDAGWEWEREVSVAQPLQAAKWAPNALRADYILLFKGLPIAVLEVKGENRPAADGMNQALSIGKRLGLKHAISTNGQDWLLIDTESGDYAMKGSIPSPRSLFSLGDPNSINWDKWDGILGVDWYKAEGKRASRLHQRIAATEILRHLALGSPKMKLVMASGSGKTMTLVQVLWKLYQGGGLEKSRVLFITDRKMMSHQMQAACHGLPKNMLQVLENGSWEIGTEVKVCISTYQALMNRTEDGRRYEGFAADYFDFIIVDECHRSTFGEWFQILKYFAHAQQVGLTAVPDSGDDTSALGDQSRDCLQYFGEPIFNYSLRQATEDGYLVPYNVKQRFLPGAFGAYQDPVDIEKVIRVPECTRMLVNDLIPLLAEHVELIPKTVVFCVDITHAAMVTRELQARVKDPESVACITSQQENRDQLIDAFCRTSSPRIAVTVNMLLGIDVPDLENVVIARPVRSRSTYNQMISLGSRPCDAIGKKSFTIIDYVNMDVFSDTDMMVREDRAEYLTQGRSVSAKELVRKASTILKRLIPHCRLELLALWGDRVRRMEVQQGLVKENISIELLRQQMNLEGVDDVDVIAKIMFACPKVITRRQRASEAMSRLGEGDIQITNAPAANDLSMRFWYACLDHYALYGIDELEVGATFSSALFVEQFGSFSGFCRQYGGAQRVREDLETIKKYIYFSEETGQGN